MRNVTTSVSGESCNIGMMSLSGPMGSSGYVFRKGGMYPRFGAGPAQCIVRLPYGSIINLPDFPDIAALHAGIFGYAAFPQLQDSLPFRYTFGPKNFFTS
jgi:hypothetical protein